MNSGGWSRWSLTARRMSQTARPSGRSRRTGSLVRWPTSVMLLTARSLLVLMRSLLAGSGVVDVVRGAGGDPGAEPSPWARGRERSDLGAARSASAMLRAVATIRGSALVGAV